MPTYKNKLIIGLTGGIGSGKSKVCELFSALGICIFNADDIAHDITKVATPCYQKIVSHFGALILKSDKSLDRKKLKEIIFSDPFEKKWLEDLLHPEIWKELQNKVTTAHSPYVILEIPLLVEVKSHPMIDRVLVIDATAKVQIQRIMQRDNLTEEQAKQIIKHQVSAEERLAYADDVIKNDGHLEHLTQQVTVLHQQYLSFASAC